MDNLLEDLLGPAACAEWFGSQLSGVSSAFRDETEMGGAQSAGTSSSASDKRMGGAASDSNFEEELDKLLMLASQQFEEQQSSTMEITFPHTCFAAPKSEEEIL